MTFVVRLIAALLILGSSLAVISSTVHGRDSVPTSSEIARPVEIDPIPDDAIYVCDSCEQQDPQAAIDAAPDGSTIVVQGGSWPALTINHPLRLVGEDWPLIDLGGEGTGITIASDDVTVEGFDIRNSGRSFDKEDSGIYFEGQRTRILNNRMTQVLFGVNGATGHDSVIAGNYVEGHDGINEGLRGDGIKVWYSQRVQIHNNHVTNSRDLLVWYSNECDVYENLVTHSRYGFHFMNSDDGFARNNEIVNNSVGIYIMYGKRFTIENNLLQGSRGPSGHGLGLKEVDGVDVINNVIYDNRVGVYNDNSPFSMNVYGNFRGNLIAFNDIGVGVLPSARANVYVKNSFVENLEHVSILGTGELSAGNQWSINGEGNYWSDYSGYDADGDGVGDLPYNNTAKVEELRRSHPNLQLFRFSLAETAIDFASEAMPFIAGKPILVDEHPLVSPVHPTGVPDVYVKDSASQSLIVSAALLLAVAGVFWWGTMPSRRKVTMENEA